MPDPTQYARRSRTKVIVIYGLQDPRNGLIRYVGKSENPTLRLYHHLRDARLGCIDQKSEWLRELIALDRFPNMVTLEIVEPGGDWEEAERRHINLRAVGLLNMSPGGEGIPGEARGLKWRAALAITHIENPNRKEGRRKAAEKLRGRKQTAETIAKRVAILKGRKMSAAQKRLLSLKHTGKKLSLEHIAKIRATKTGQKKSLETRARMCVAARQRWFDPEYRAKVTAAMRRATRKRSERRRAK